MTFASRHSQPKPAVPGRPRRRQPGHTNLKDASTFSVLPPKMRKDSNTMSREYIHTMPSSTPLPSEEIVAYVPRAVPKGRPRFPESEQASNSNSGNGSSKFSTATATAASKYCSDGSSTSSRKNNPLKVRRGGRGIGSVLDSAQFRNGFRVMRWQGLAKGKSVGGLLPTSGLKDEARTAIKHWYNGSISGRQCALLVSAAEQHTPSGSSSGAGSHNNAPVEPFSLISGLTVDLTLSSELERQLFDDVFALSPNRVLTTAVEIFATEVGESPEKITYEEVCLSAKRLSISESRVTSPVEWFKIQIYLDLVHLYVDGAKATIAERAASELKDKASVGSHLISDTTMVSSFGASASAVRKVFATTNIDNVMAQNGQLVEYMNRLMTLKRLLLAHNKSSKRADAYNFFQLNEGASTKDIQKAYKDLARQLHPDRGGCTQRFQQLQDAYNSIKNMDGGEVKCSFMPPELESFVSFVDKSVERALELASSISKSAQRCLKDRKQAESPSVGLKGQKWLVKLQERGLESLETIADDLRSLANCLRKVGLAAESDMVEWMQDPSLGSNMVTSLREHASSAEMLAETCEDVNSETKEIWDQLGTVQPSVMEVAKGSKKGKIWASMLGTGFHRVAISTGAAAHSGMEAAGFLREFREHITTTEWKRSKEEVPESPQSQPAEPKEEEPEKEESDSSGSSSSKSSVKPDKEPSEDPELSDDLERQVGIRVRTLSLLSKLNVEVCELQQGLRKKAVTAKQPKHEAATLAAGFLEDACSTLPGAIARDGREKAWREVFGFVFALDNLGKLALPVDPRTGVLRSLAVVDPHRLRDLLVNIVLPKLVSDSTRKASQVVRNRFDQIFEAINRFHEAEIAADSSTE